MSYAFQNNTIGMPPVTTIDAAAKMPLGTMGYAVDPVLGGAEFVYLPGAANTVLGSLVTYNQATPTTTLAATGAQNGNPVAVAMAPVLAGQFGWYQICGQARIAKTTGAAIALGAALLLSATAGAIVTAATPGAAGTLDSAFCCVAALSTDTTVAAQISRPALN